MVDPVRGLKARVWQQASVEGERCLFDLVIRMNVWYSGMALSANVHGTIGFLHGGLWSFEARKKKKGREKQKEDKTKQRVWISDFFVWGNGNGRVGGLFSKCFCGRARYLRTGTKAGSSQFVNSITLLCLDWIAGRLHATHGQTKYKRVCCPSGWKRHYRQFFATMYPGCIVLCTEYKKRKCTPRASSELEKKIIKSHISVTWQQPQSVSFMKRKLWLRNIVYLEWERKTMLCNPWCDVCMECFAQNSWRRPSSESECKLVQELVLVGDFKQRLFA